MAFTYNQAAFFRILKTMIATHVIAFFSGWIAAVVVLTTLAIRDRRAVLNLQRVAANRDNPFRGLTESGYFDEPFTMRRAELRDLTHAEFEYLAYAEKPGCVQRQLRIVD